MKLRVAVVLGGCAIFVPAFSAAETITVCPSGCDAVTVTDGVAMASTGNTVLIHPGTYVEPSYVMLDKSLTVRGSGPKVTFVQGAGSQKIFIIAPTLPADSVVAIEDLNLSNGNSGQGGAGGAVSIYGIQSPVTIEITNCVIESNEAGYGGAISMMYSWWADLTIDRTLIRENFAWTTGGGVRIYGGTLTISNSAIVNNQGYYTGGVYVDNGSTLTMVNTTVSGNTADGMLAGGVHGYYDSVMDISFSTIADNTGAGGFGAGVATENGTVTLTACLLSNPSGSNCSGALASNGFNISSDSSCGLNATGDASNQSPGLGSFVNTDDFKSHYPLLSASIARDRADSGTYPPTDQLGVPRPQDGDGDGSQVCDSGAIEAEEGPFFSDDFESGNTSAWSTASP